VNESAFELMPCWMDYMEWQSHEHLTQIAGFDVLDDVLETTVWQDTGGKVPLDDTRGLYGYQRQGRM